ncbi:GGDEF domain-containing protein [Modicisalibacter ilicicola]|nr:GGDEF domain-containing protein [Halomonas ilicicola]
MPLFLWVGIPLLTGLNLLCIAVNVLAIRLHCHGYFVLALLIKLAAAAILITVASMLLGNDIGFEYYFFIILFEILISDLSRPQKLLLSGILMSLFLAMIHWLSGLLGSWSLGEPARELLHAVNLATVFILITFIAMQVYSVSETTERRFRSDASRDSLTGVYNRRAIIECAEALWEQRRSLALLLLDADHFKQINDTYGHSAGDKVLRHIAQLLQRTLREGDSIGRVGGEEFLILLPDTSCDEALSVASRLRDQLVAQPCPLGKRTLPVTLSMGLALSYEDKALQGVIDLADRRLYVAKSAGRDQLVAEGGDSLETMVHGEIFTGSSSREV